MSSEKNERNIISYEDRMKENMECIRKVEENLKFLKENMNNIEGFYNYVDIKQEEIDDISTKKDILVNEYQSDTDGCFSLDKTNDINKTQSNNENTYPNEYQNLNNENISNYNVCQDMENSYMGFNEFEDTTSSQEELNYKFYGDNNPNYNSNINYENMSDSTYVNQNNNFSNYYANQNYDYQNNNSYNEYQNNTQINNMNTCEKDEIRLSEPNKDMRPNNKTRELFNNHVSASIGDIAPMNIRLKAYVIDRLIMLIPLVCLYFAYLNDSVMEVINTVGFNGSFATIVEPLMNKFVGYFIVYCLLYIAYFVIFPIFSKGQTFGKKKYNLRIVNVDVDDPDLSFSTLLRRETICRFVPSILFLGYIKSYFSKSGIAMHDISSETRVIIDGIVEDNNKI